MVSLARNRRITSSLRRAQREQQEQRPCSRQREQLRAQQEQQRGREQERELLLFCHKQPGQQPGWQPESETFACYFLQGS